MLVPILLPLLGGLLVFLLKGAVVQMAGIKDIRAKCLRSSNPSNVVKATFEGLKALRTAEEVAVIRGVSKESLK